MRRSVASYLAGLLAGWMARGRALSWWFKERFPSRYQVTPLFDDELKQGFGLQPPSEGRPDVLVSVPERALLEWLSDAGKVQSLAETRQLVEFLYSLRHRHESEGHGIYPPLRRNFRLPFRGISFRQL
jgi:hypothetical protein